MIESIGVWQGVAMDPPCSTHYVLIGLSWVTRL
jgi:hypothetical protein